MEKDNSPIEYEGEDYRGQADLKSQQIILRAYNKALLEGSKELTQEGTRTRLIDGQPVVVATPNQKEIFVNSVEMSYLSLSAFVAKCTDKKLVERINNNLAKKEKIFHFYRQRINEIQRRNQYDDSKIFETNELISFENKRREHDIYLLHKDLLQLLTELLAHYNYFEEGGSHK